MVIRPEALKGSNDMNSLVVLQDVKMEAMIRGARYELSRYPYHHKAVDYIEPVSAIVTDNLTEFMAIRVQFYGSKSPNWFVVRKCVYEDGTLFNVYKHTTKKEALEIVNRWATVSKYVDEDNVCQVIPFPKAS